MARQRTVLALAMALAALCYSVGFVGQGMQPTGRVPQTAARAEAKKAPKKKAKGPWVGPKKGSWVKILRPESYWFQQRGQVVNVNQKPEVKYPVTVKFDSVNYANVNTNGYALWEVIEAPAPGPGEATFCGGGFMGQRITSPSGTSMGQATPMQYGVVNGPVGSDRRSSSESGNTASFTETSGRRFSPSSPNGHVARKPTDSAEGGFVFSMYEENDLISPQVSRIHGRTIPEEKQSSFDLDGGKVRNGSKEATWEPGSAQSQTLPGGRRISEDPVAPLPPAASKASKRPQTIRKSPLLWTEDELAAFMGCLGLSTDICQRVMGRKIKGASQLLSMTDAQLRKYLGLVTPVERLVVRHALKRLLDAARWENNVCGHKGMDILSDSVLSHYIVPKEELTLVSRISQGGYGTVYRGVLEPKVDRAGGTFQARRTHLVAVKDMKGERRVQLYELLKEACVMASLSHPNICTFVGVSMDPEKKRHYIISELMDCSLFDMIHQPYKLRWHGELTVALSLSLGTGIISGICYIHQKNLVHADLKSSNILIDYTSSSRHPVPRICDFGHAAVRCHPSPHHRCGTPHWASPEVLRGEALGPAADIYSFGVMLWEMLTQKLPHKDMSFGQVLASVGWAGSTPDMAQLPELPKEVNRIIKETREDHNTEKYSEKGPVEA
ncbi:unnamed protein product [Symbiodinium necroappetens]|uniref:Protein kinase domain-containing protein n=1 Tax=Symbiodinium necroappetens TaxID=1628268 RepID=A0A812Q512_9DINO|nr:unnamed protein product [Symbiodinium necroappetens]